MCLNLLLLSYQVVLCLQNPFQMTAIYGLDPLHQPSLSSVCCPSSYLPAEPPGNEADSQPEEPQQDLPKEPPSASAHTPLLVRVPLASWQPVLTVPTPWPQHPLIRSDC